MSKSDPSQENLSDNKDYDEDVQRYEADSYKQKYGDRWKKLASSVRDVVQPDGTIIREYVIEDPAMLDNLSEDDDEQGNHKSANTRLEQKAAMSEHDDTYSSDSLDYQKIIDSVKKRDVTSSNYDLHLMNNDIVKKNTHNMTYMSNLNLNEINRNGMGKVYANHSKSYFDKTKSKSSYNLANDQLNRCFKTIENNGHYATNSRNGVSFNKTNTDEDDEFDKEIESIHEQGEQLKQYESQMNDQEQNMNQEQVVEYEIVDENGNQILINDAQNLKSLATSMSEVRQPDGTIVKEYILNDPKIIEQIRDKIKSDSMDNLLANQKPPAEAKPIYQNHGHFSSSTNFEQTQVPMKKVGGVNQNSIKKESPSLLKNSMNQSYENLGKILAQNSIKKKNTPSPPASRLSSNTATTIVPAPPLPPFLNQVKETIKKFQENASSKTPPEKRSSITGRRAEKENLKKFISSSNFTEFLEAEKKRIQSSNNKPQEVNHLSRSKEQAEIRKQVKSKSPQHQDIIKRINRNKFEIRTKKGKSVQFMITSDDPTDSEIEECKSILNKSFDNLSTIESSRKRDSPRKDLEQQMNLKQSESAKIIQSTGYRNEGAYERQRTMEPIKSGPNYTSFSKFNEQPTHSIVAPKVVNKCAESRKCFNENRQIIIEASMNTKNSANMHQQQSDIYDVIGKSIGPESKHQQQSLSYSNLSAAEINNYESFFNIPNNSKQSPTFQNKRINNGTYTKSSINLDQLPPDSGKRNPRPSQATTNNNRSLFHSSLLNKSVDNLNENDLKYNPSLLENLNIPPEMTQQLLVQLLLQQISSNLYPHQKGDDFQSQNGLNKLFNRNPTSNQKNTSSNHKHYDNIDENDEDYSESSSSEKERTHKFKRRNSRKYNFNFEMNKNNYSSPKYGGYYEPMQSYGFDKTV